MNILYYAWQIYKKEPFWVRLHILGRAVLCPFAPLLPYFPETGEILDVGCGYGFLLHLLKREPSNKNRKLFGIDHDLKKINIAGKYADDNMDFSEKCLEELPEQRFDVVSVTDVLYSVSLDKWGDFLNNCYRVLKKNGVLVIKEAVKASDWRYFVTMLEEKLAVEILKITRGDKPHLESINIYRDAIEKNGFRFKEVRLLKSWRPASHCIFIAHKVQ